MALPVAGSQNTTLNNSTGPNLVPVTSPFNTAGGAAAGATPVASGVSGALGAAFNVANNAKNAALGAVAPALNMGGYQSGGGGTPSATPTAAQAAKLQGLITYGIGSVQASGQGDITNQQTNLVDTGQNAVNGPSGVANTQAAIDEARKEIGVTQINSVKQLMHTIHNGLQGVGVQLGNTGALSSSARDAAARAYANYGNVGVNTANNTAAIGNQAQDVQQQDLSRVIGGDKVMLDQARDNAIKSILADVSGKLDALKTTITFAGGDPNSVPAQQTQQSIVQQAQDALGQIDQNYQNMLNGVNPATADQTAQNAESASNAGVVPSSQTPFSSTNLLQNPQSTQTAGAPPPSLIPLTLGPTKNTQIGV